MTTSTRPGPPPAPGSHSPHPLPDGPADAGYRPDLRRSRLALWSADHRWAVLALSLLTLAVGIWTMVSVGITTADQDDILVGDSAVANELLQSDFGQGPTELVVVTDPDGPLTAEELSALSGELEAEYTGLDGVEAVGAPFPGAGREPRAPRRDEDR